jgi:hypothetical protein
MKLNKITRCRSCRSVVTSHVQVESRVESLKGRVTSRVISVSDRVESAASLESSHWFKSSHSKVESLVESFQFLIESSQRLYSSRVTGLNRVTQRSSHYTRNNWENQQLVASWYRQAWTRLCGPLWTYTVNMPVTALFNCNNLEQHGWQLVHSWPHNIVHACRYQLATTCAFLAV